MSEKSDSAANLDDVQARMIADAGAARARTIITHDYLRGIIPTLGWTTAGTSESIAKKRQTLSNPFVSSSLDKSGEGPNDIDACEPEYESDGLDKLLNISDFQDMGYFKSGKEPLPSWTYIVEPAPHGDELAGGFKERNVLGRFAFVGLFRFVAPFSSIPTDEIRALIKDDLDPSALARIGNTPLEFAGTLSDYLKYVDPKVLSEEDKVRLKQEFNTTVKGMYLDVTEKGENKIYQWPDINAFASVIRNVKGEEMTTSQLIRFMPYITNTGATSPSREGFKLYGAPEEHVENIEESDKKKRYGYYQKFNVGRASELWRSNGAKNSYKRFWAGLTPNGAYGNGLNDYFFYCGQCWWNYDYFRGDPNSEAKRKTSDWNEKAGNVTPAYAGLLWQEEIHPEAHWQVAIPYISGMEDGDAARLGYKAGSTSIAMALRAQMMANLKDYCDEYEELIHASTPRQPKRTNVYESQNYLNGGGARSIAQGVECAPEINEMMIMLQTTIDEVDPENRTISVELKTADVELAKMYRAVDIDRYRTKYMYNYEITFSDGSLHTLANYQDGSFTDKREPIIQKDHIPRGEGGYAMYTEVFARASNTTKAVVRVGKDAQIPKVTKIQIKNNRLWFEPWADFNTGDGNAILFEISPPGFTIDLSGELDADGDQFIFGYQADDPRASYNPAMWNVINGTPDKYKNGNYFGKVSGGDISSATTYMKKNWICSVGKRTSSVFGWDCDEEEANEPWETSSSYIRNGPMRSLWEVGFVHRIAPWQTFNLKKMAPMNGDPKNQFMKLSNQGYREGDARILDQLKIGRQTQTYGRVNISKITKESLTALFAGGKYRAQPPRSTVIPPKQFVVPDGSDVNSSSNLHEDILEGKQLTGSLKDTYPYRIYRTEEDAVEFMGKELSSREMEDFVDEVIVQQGKLLPKYDNIREAFPEMLSEAAKNVLGIKSDVYIEEFYGKVANLIDDESPMEYAVLVVGQAIRDVGKKGLFEGPQKDGIVATQKVLYIFTLVTDKDPLKSKWVITQKLYLND